MFACNKSSLNNWLYTRIIISLRLPMTVLFSCNRTVFCPYCRSPIFGAKNLKNALLLFTLHRLLLLTKVTDWIKSFCLRSFLYYVFECKIGERRDGDQNLEAGFQKNSFVSWFLLQRCYINWATRTYLFFGQHKISCWCSNKVTRWCVSVVKGNPTFD